MKQQLAAVLAGLALSSAAMNSYADSYIGLSFGVANYSDTSKVADDLLAAARSEDPATNASSASITESDSGTKFFYGYNFSKSFAVELSYNDLGTVGLDGTINVVTGGANAGTVAYDVTGDITSLGVAGLYKFEIDSSVKPFVKLGLHSWELDGAATITSTGTLSGVSQLTTVNETDSGTGLMYSLGMDIGLSKPLDLRLEYEYFDIGDDTLTSSVTTLSAGLSYKF